MTTKTRELVLVTGGSGYIGSHTVLELLKEDYDIVVVDSLINSSTESLKRVEKLAGRKILKFYRLDLRDRDGLEKIFAQHKFSSVIHFAALKAVGESVRLPLMYYANNVCGAIALFEVMEKFNVTRLVFSSSSTVYGEKNVAPFHEGMDTSSINPYGGTKLAIEKLLIDMTNDPATKWEVSMLRYFNPIGAHESGEIGDDPTGIPNNLVPFIEQVAVGRRECLTVFGNDYETVDGTCVRDYLHVVDLALGHVIALRKLSKGMQIYNLATNKGLSVLEVIKAFERVNDIKINYKFGPRRPGDVATSYADSTKAQKELGWNATRSIEDMVGSAWKWRKANPQGYVKSDSL